MTHLSRCGLPDDVGHGMWYLEKAFCRIWSHWNMSDLFMKSVPRGKKEGEKFDRKAAFTDLPQKECWKRVRQQHIADVLSSEYRAAVAAWIETEGAEKALGGIHESTLPGEKQLVLLRRFQEWTCSDPNNIAAAVQRRFFSDAIAMMMLRFGSRSDTPDLMHAGMKQCWLNLFLNSNDGAPGSSGNVKLTADFARFYIRFGLASPEIQAAVSKLMTVSVIACTAVLLLIVVRQCTAVKI